MRKTKLFLSALLIVIMAALATNSYAQWTFVGFVTGGGTYPSISVYSPTVLFVGGGPNGVPMVARSTNGGAAFTIVPTAGINLEFYCIWGGNETTVYAGDGGVSGGAGGNAHVYKTTNLGVNWSIILSTGGTAGFINSIVFQKNNPLIGFVESDPPSGAGQAYWVQKTTDGGLTWTLQSPPPPGITNYASSQNGMYVIDNQFWGHGCSYALAAAGASKMWGTSNGGTSYFNATFPIGTTSGFTSGIAFSSDKLRGFAGTSGSLPNVGKTVNGGTTWTSFSIGTGVTGYFNCKWIYGTEIVYIAGQVGASGVIKRSSDGGTTWTQMTTNGIVGITHMDYYKDPATNAIDMFAVATDGSVIHYLDNSLVGINPNNNSVPTAFKLEQNYPNPFNPTTTINYSIPKNGNVSLKIYDMLGHEVINVVNGYQVAGNYTETINASELPSGVYFYTLTSGDFTDSKKMTLVK